MLAPALPPYPVRAHGTGRGGRRRPAGARSPDRQPADQPRRRLQWARAGLAVHVGPGHRPEGRRRRADLGRRRRQPGRHDVGGVRVGRAARRPLPAVGRCLPGRPRPAPPPRPRRTRRAGLHRADLEAHERRAPRPRDVESRRMPPGDRPDRQDEDERHLLPHVPVPPVRALRVPGSRQEHGSARLRVPIPGRRRHDRPGALRRR